MPEASEPRTKYFIAASEATGLSRSIATSAYWDSASISRPRYTITRLPAETISIMPAARTARARYSPLYRPRSRRYGANTGTRQRPAVGEHLQHVAHRRDEHAVEHRARPPYAVAHRHEAATTSEQRQHVRDQRGRSSRNRSITSRTHGAASTSSRSSDLPAHFRPAAHSFDAVIVHAPGSRSRVPSGRSAASATRRAPARRSRTRPARCTRAVHVLELGDVRVGHLAEDHALDQPQV